MVLFIDVFNTEKDKGGLLHSVMVSGSSMVYLLSCFKVI